MIAQGSVLADTVYIDALIARVGSIDICSELQAFVTEIMAELQAQIAAIEQQLLNLAPIKALLEIPTDLASAISWITKFVAAQIEPAYLAFIVYVSQLAALVAKVEQLISAVETAAARLVSCVVSIPALVVSDAAQALLTSPPIT